MKLFLFLLFLTLGVETTVAQNVVVSSDFPIKVVNSKKNVHNTNPIASYQAARLEFNEPTIFTPQMEDLDSFNFSLVNFPHPELLEGEVYFINIRTDLYWERLENGELTIIGADLYTSVERTLEKFPVIFARVGLTPYGEDGKELKNCNCLPAFVQRSDLEDVGVLKK